MYNIFTDIRKTLVASTGLHLLLLLFFLFTRTGFDFDTEGFAEVSFVASTDTRSTTPTPAPRTVVVEEPPEVPPEIIREEQPRAEQEEPTGASGSLQNEAPVDLPRRRSLQDQEALPRNRQTDKLTTDQGSSDIPRRIDRYESRQPGQVNPERSLGEKITASPQQMALTEPGVTPTADSGSPANAQPFTIEGQAAERDIISKVIPDYPEGLQREALIRIRFTVLPDGRVGQMIPIQKDYPRLEEITLQALKQWRFNPLPPGADQTTVQGVITFRYELL